MLRELVSRLMCPGCMREDALLDIHVFSDGTSGHIKDGVLICRNCNEWYPIENGLLELVNISLVDQSDAAVFFESHRKELEKLNLLPKKPLNSMEIKSEPKLAERLLQKTHFDWYADNQKQSYDEFKKQPFWRALDKITINKWKSRIKHPCWILDIGCADGVSTFPFANAEATVIGVDISKNMIRKAIGIAERVGANEWTSFIVADGSNIPFKQQTFEYVLNYGSIHHMPEPEKTCREIQKILKVHGIHFAMENNKSIFRPVFDLIMKLWPIWYEEAGEEPLITREMVENWIKDLPAIINYSSTVYLPPHLLNLFGYQFAYEALKITDRLFSNMWGLKNNGGISIFEIQKQ